MSMGIEKGSRIEVLGTYAWERQLEVLLSHSEGPRGNEWHSAVSPASHLKKCTGAVSP